MVTMKATWSWSQQFLSSQFGIPLSLSVRPQGFSQKVFWGLIGRNKEPIEDNSEMNPPDLRRRETKNQVGGGTPREKERDGRDPIPRWKLQMFFKCTTFARRCKGINHKLLASLGQRAKSSSLIVVLFSKPLVFNNCFEQKLKKKGKKCKQKNKIWRLYNNFVTNWEVLNL